MLVNVSEAAKLLAISESTFRRHVASAIPSVKIGRLRRWRKEDLEKYICEDQKGARHTRRSFGYMVEDMTGEQGKGQKMTLREWRKKFAIASMEKALSQTQISSGLQ